MNRLLLCTFAVGSPDGPRSSSFDLSLTKDRPELHLSARTQASRWEVTVKAPPPDGARSMEEAATPPTKQRVRQAVFEGAWVGEAGLAAAWPGHQIAPGTWRQLSLYISGGVLRKLEQPPDVPEPLWITPPEGFGHVVVSVLVSAATPGARPVLSAGEQLLGAGELPDRRKVWVSSRREDVASPLLKAGLFMALRKRSPPGISQAEAWRDGMRVLFACELDGAGLVVEMPADLFRSPGNC